MTQKKSNLPRELEERAKAQNAVERFFVLAKDAEGKEVKVYPRAMKRGELKELQSRGLDPTFWTEKRALVRLQNVDEKDTEAMAEAILANLDEADALARKNAEFIDAVLEIVYPGLDFDDVPQPKCNKLATLVHQMTNGRDEEIKNS